MSHVDLNELDESVLIQIQHKVVHKVEAITDDDEGSDL